MLSSDAVLDANAIAVILSSGNSRVPVFRAPLAAAAAAAAGDGDGREGGPSVETAGGQQPPPRLQFCGVLLVKELLLLDPEAGVSAGQMVKRSLLEIPADMPLFDALTLFQVMRGRAYLSHTPTPMSPLQARFDALPAARFGAPLAARQALPWLSQAFPPLPLSCRRVAGTWLWSPGHPSCKVGWCVLREGLPCLDKCVTMEGLLYPDNAEETGPLLHNW